MRVGTMIVRAACVAILLIAVGGTATANSNHFFANARYSIPLNPPVPADDENGEIPPGAAESLQLGGGYRFWGIFHLTGDVYTEILYDSDAFLNIKQIRPLSLFALGFGLEIPLGGLGFTLDWQRVLTGIDPPEGVRDFAGKFSWGISLEVISDRLDLLIFNDRLSLTEDASEEYNTANSRYTTLGLGTRVRF